jgi:hypothetical protein
MASGTGAEPTGTTTPAKNPERCRPTNAPIRARADQIRAFDHDPAEPIRLKTALSETTISLDNLINWKWLAWYRTPSLSIPG